MAYEQKVEWTLGTYYLDNEGIRKMEENVPQSIKSQIGTNANFYMDCIDDSKRLIPQRTMSSKAEKSTIVQLRAKLQEFENGEKLLQHKNYNYLKDLRAEKARQERIINNASSNISFGPKY